MSFDYVCLWCGKNYNKWFLEMSMREYVERIKEAEISWNGDNHFIEFPSDCFCSNECYEFHKEVNETSSHGVKRLIADVWRNMKLIKAYMDKPPNLEGVDSEELQKIMKEEEEEYDKLREEEIFCNMNFRQVLKEIIEMAIRI